MNTPRTNQFLHRSSTKDSGYSSGSDYGPFPEGDLSEIWLDYEEPGSMSSKAIGKRKESPLTSEDDEDCFFPSKRARSPEYDHSDMLNPSVPYLIAHCPKAQKLIDKLNLSHGVSFELARLITTGGIHYKDITLEKLDVLRGSNNAAVPQIMRVFQKDGSNSDAAPSAVDIYFADEIAANSPWKELDREETALARDPYEGLGNNPKEPDWYGGKVEFRGRLKSQGKGKPSAKSHEIILDNCTLGPSSRFTRRFGSWSFLKIKIPQDMFHNANNNLDVFFKKPFIVWGKVFRACYAKDDNIFLYWTNETYPFGSSTIPGRLSFEEFIHWHNPIEYNTRQLMTKWSARTALGFSNSVPGPRIRQEFFQETEDIMSEKGSDMTDGCGLATKSVYRALLEQLSLTTLPTAFQFRLAGCKGMLVFHEDHAQEFPDNEHRVWVRPSQTKIRYPVQMPLDPAMLTFDILRVSRLTTPSKISAEIIINLAENGVPHSAFVDLLKSSVREMFEGLTTWQGPNAMFNLWLNVERAGGVMSSRRAREAVGEARVRGYSNRSPEDVELDDNVDEDGLSDDIVGSVPKSVAWWADQISGCPSSLEETVMVLLDSGFHPRHCPILREKLKKVVGSKIESRTQNLRFELKQSCIAFAVPDPYSVLGPDEIQIKSSRRNLEGQDGLLTDIILGDVLIARNPCKVPSDIRKVKAVDHPMLRNFVDVVVFSVQGYRRLIDFLAGGDYDGDTVLVVWAILIVFHFHNAHEKFSLEPAGLNQAFSRDTETGNTFLDRTKNLAPEQKFHAMQKYLLGALVDPSLVGKYSVMHNNVIYHLGYSHPRTHKIAAKFVRVLDSHKTGYRIKQETIQADMKQYQHTHGPQWQAASKEKKKKVSKPRFDESLNSTFLQRDWKSDHVKGEFIMDRLRKAAEQERQALLIEVDKLFAPLLNEPDAALIKPWDDAVKWAERATGHKDSVKSKRGALAKIAMHVQEMYRRNKAIYSRRKDNSSKLDPKTGNSFTNLAIEVRQDELRALSKAFASAPLLEDVPDIPDQATLNRWRASYAYKYDAEQNFKDGEQGWTRFPWNVALRELCAIKAPSEGAYKVVSNNFYERFKLINPR